MASSIGIIILAGGGSRRMGEDKGLIEVNGKAVIQFLIDSCKTFSNDILIVSNSKDYDKFGFPTLGDVIHDIGPLGGLYTGLEQSKHDCNIVLSCDVPLVSVELLQKLIDNKDESELAVITQYQNQVHPLIGIYYRTCLSIIKKLVEQKMYRMSNLYKHKDATILDLSHFPEKEFLNLNTQAELEIFKQHINDR